MLVFVLILAHSNVFEFSAAILEKGLLRKQWKILSRYNVTETKWLTMLRRPWSHIERSITNYYGLITKLAKAHTM